MAKKSSYNVWLLPSFSRNGRGIAFLVCDDDKHCDAKGIFKGLKTNSERAVLQAFEAWLDHHDSLVWRFHGWPNHPDYKGCFTFKWKERNSGQRFYGFLHGIDEYEQGYQLCVLILHAQKNERETDTTELDRVVSRRHKPEVLAALRERTLTLKREGWPKS